MRPGAALRKARGRSGMIGAMRAGCRWLLATCAIAVASCGDDDATRDSGALDATMTDVPRRDATLDADARDASETDAMTTADSGRDGAPDATAMDATRDDGGDAGLDAAAAGDLGTMDAAIDDLGTGDVGSGDAGPRCALEGSWHLEEIRCDAMDVTADWTAVIPSSTLEIATNATGECHIATTHSGPTCREVQEVDAQSDGSWLSLGITACEPAACQFTPTDAPCTIGDRAGVQRPAVERMGDRFTVTWMPSDAGGFCGRFGMTTRETFALD